MIKSFLANMPRPLRMALLSLVSLAVLGGCVFGVLLLIRGGGSAVNVYAAMDLSVNYASSGSAQTQGMVTTDKVQSVFITTTQRITEVHVKEGDRIAVGDPILSFDTTLTDLELERQRIAVEQLKLDLDKALRHQAEVNTYQVYVAPAPQPEPELTPSTLPMLRKGAGSKDDPYVYVWNDSCSYTAAFFDSLLPNAGEAVSAEGLPVSYVVFEVRQGDSLQGDILRSWELILRRDLANNWSFTLVEPEYDPSVEGEEPAATPAPVTGNFVSSWAELQKMKKDAAQRLIDLELQLKQAELKYETLEYELSSGVVLSKIDGVVKSVLDAEAALAENKPVVLLSGGGGYYVTGALSETELATMVVGGTVNVRSWENYENLTGTIVEISEFPVEGGQYWHYSSGNRNVSLYPFTVFLPEDANLRENEYVEISYDPGASQGGGLCLQNAFIRTENGKSYIWVRGADGLLEKREVQTGRSLWGSYLEILSGFGPEDYVAFPYGRDIRPGAKTKEAAVTELYSNY